MQKLGIYWFDQDFRIDDNLGLTIAAKQVDQLLCIAFANSKSRNPHHPIPIDMAANRLDFLTQSLANLDQNLKGFGQYLLISKEPPQAKLAALIKRHGITHLYLSDDGNFTRKPILESLQTKFPLLVIKQVGDNRLFSEDSLPFPISELPSTFSKFRRKVEKITTQPLTPTTDRLPPPVISSEAEANEFSDKRAVHQGEFCGGETEGRKHLKRYFQGDYASSYKLTRNSLDGFYNSTKFSPWLTNGCLSVRQVVAQLHQYEAHVVSNDSTYWIFFELLWREYFQWYAKCHREKLFLFSGIKGFKPATSFYPERFQKWCHGNTPYPIVNACIKQLNVTGYMSNRGRQLVASCLVNELALDWRYGAAYMEQRLIDYDMASNWGNWQYLAGVGADPRGLRHFDLDKQTQRYDPNHQFIKHWQGIPNQQHLDSIDAADWPISQSQFMQVSQSYEPE